MKVENFFKLLEWILYLGLFLTSIYFTWGVMVNFNSGTTGIRQYEESIKSYPTVTICLGKNPIWKQWNDFNISWVSKSHYDHTENFTILKIGENYIQAEETINLKEVFTLYEGICYSLTFHGNFFEKQMYLWFDSSWNPLPEMKVYFTSEKNSWGITASDWKDGEVFVVNIAGGHYKYIHLRVKKNIKKNCNDQSFYECAGSKIVLDLSKCPNICIPLTLPNTLGQEHYKKDSCRY